MATAAGTPRRFGILISGRGSNMEALARAALAGEIPARPAVVISNEASAGGLRVAQGLGLPTAVVDHRDSADRATHDRRVQGVLEEHGAELVCLAGYMRLLSASFVAAFPARILNIHPSLLPAFPGLDAQRQALEHGAKVSGCTVHFVDADLDSGPIIAQTAVPVAEDDTEASLSRRILAEEHRLYVGAVRLYFQDRLRLEGRRVRIAEAPGG